MNSSLFWCIAGIIGGAIISFIISYFFYFKGLSRKYLTYEINTISVISKKINLLEGLEIKYDSKVIQELYYSTIIIKNVGNTFIRNEDFVPRHPITVMTTGQFFKNKNEHIDSNPINKNTNYNLVVLNQPCTRIQLTFDYIPQKAIIKFSIFHIGDIFLVGNLFDGEIIPMDKLKSKKLLIKRIIFFIIKTIIFIIAMTLIISILRLNIMLT